MQNALSRIRFGALVLSAGLLAACGSGDKFDNAAPDELPGAVKADTAEGSGTEAPDPAATAGTSAPSSVKAQKLVDMCIAEGASAEVCACQITAVEDGLDPGDFVRLVDLAEAGDEDAAKSMLSDIMSNNPHIAAQMSNDILNCATN